MRLLAGDIMALGILAAVLIITATRAFHKRLE
jgi:hypothetical protein